MSFFETVVEWPPDPILGLNISFAEDCRINKVNLGAGVYKTDELKPFILNTVKKAEAILLQKENSKDYLPIDGQAEYIQHTKELIFGKNALLNHIYGAQTVGGTAALSVGARFLKELGLHTVFVSTPTWANHYTIFHDAHFKVQTYPYYDRTGRNVAFVELIKTIEQMESKSILLLQVCCHNPTGLDPSLDQWQEICKLMKQKQIFPFFDLAYQGFGDDPEKDAFALQLFLQQGLTFALAVSHAKSFGIYAERCGALFLACQDHCQVKRVASRIKMIIRGLYSNPPSHGAKIVTTILQNNELKMAWRQELAMMRTRIKNMRQALTACLMEVSSEFSFLNNQKGMFSYTGLTEKHVMRLIDEYGIYLPKDGRINVAGLNNDNLPYVIDAIHSVYQT